jgi:hypothetical protein
MGFMLGLILGIIIGVLLGNDKARIWWVTALKKYLASQKEKARIREDLAIRQQKEAMLKK